MSWTTYPFSTGEGAVTVRDFLNGMARILHGPGNTFVLMWSIDKTADYTVLGSFSSLEEAQDMAMDVVRTCDECGSKEIGPTESVCLVCSARAYKDGHR